MDVFSKACPGKKKITIITLLVHIVQWWLCFQLQILPGAGETYILGALRARHIYVQRRRVREALQIVDPISRAIRQSRTLVRRVYSVPCPNALWYVNMQKSLIVDIV